MGRKHSRHRRAREAARPRGSAITVLERPMSQERRRTMPARQPAQPAHNRSSAQGSRRPVAHSARPTRNGTSVAPAVSVRPIPVSTRRAWRSRIFATLTDPWLLVALAIAAGAFALRVVGTNYGLPYHYNWDEPTIVNRAMRMGSGDLNPHDFFYPGLSYYVTFATEIGLYIVGHLLHVYPSLNAFGAAYFTNSAAFYLVGRVMGALLGAVTVVICFIVGRRFFNPLVGVLAALLLAVSAVHVGYSHFITNDVPIAFFALLTYIWLWNVYTRGLRWDYLLAGVTIGLGTATKYLPVFLLIPLALAHLFRIHRQTGRWWPRRADFVPLVLGGAAALLTFCIVSPYNLLDWRTALHAYVAQPAVSYAVGSNTAPLNYAGYLTTGLPWSIGWPAYLAALIGFVAIVRTRGERRKQLILLAAYPVLFFLVIGSARQLWDRWLVSLQPFLALSAAAMACWCASRVPDVWKRFVPRARIGSRVPMAVALAVVMLVLVLPPAVFSLRYDAYLLSTDTRTQAVDWFDAHVPSQMTIAIQPLFDRYFLTAPIMTTSQLTKLEQDIPANKVVIRQAVDRYYHARPLYPDVPWVYDLATLRAEGVRYVVLSSANSYASGVDRAVEERFYADLRAQGKVVAQFSPPPDPEFDDAGMPAIMPVITIYALPASTKS